MSDINNGQYISFRDDSTIEKNISIQLALTQQEYKLTVKTI